MNKSKRITQILAMFSEIYETEISESYIELYIRMLDPYPLEQIEAGCEKLIKGKTYKSYPTPGEFISYMQDDRSSPEVQSTLALDKVMQMCKIADSDNTVEFDDPLISHTLDILGGWQHVYQTIVFNKDKLSILHSQFDKTYQRLHKANVDVPVPLIGDKSWGKIPTVKRLPDHVHQQTKQLAKNENDRHLELIELKRKNMEDGDAPF